MANKDFHDLPPAKRHKVLEAMQYMKNHLGCKVTTGPQTVVLASPRIQLSAALGYPDDMGAEMWQQIKRYVPTHFGSEFHLANVTTVDGGWTTDWYWTNDPARMKGHTVAHRSTRNTQATTHSPLHAAAAGNSDIAGVVALINRVEDDLGLLLFERLPDLVMQVQKGTLSFPSSRAAVLAMTKEARDAVVIDDFGYDLGELIWKIQSSAASPAVSTGTTGP